MGRGLDPVQEARLTPIRDGRYGHVEQIRRDTRGATSIRPVAIGARRGSIGTTTWDRVAISKLFYYVLCESMSGTRAKSLLIEDLGDLTIGRVGRQGAQPREGNGVGPACIAGALGSRYGHDSTGFGLPADGHLDHRLGPCEADIFD